MAGFPFQGQQPTFERFLFFHSLLSGNENAVPLSVIKDALIWERNPNAVPEAFQVLGSRGVQTPGNFCFLLTFEQRLTCFFFFFSAEAMDSNGNLFFVLTNPPVLVCWDSTTPYNRQNIRQVYRNDATLQFASGLKILKNNLGVEELWVMTNRFQVCRELKSSFFVFYQ